MFWPICGVEPGCGTYALVLLDDGLSDSYCCCCAPASGEVTRGGGAGPLGGGGGVSLGGRPYGDGAIGGGGACDAVGGWPPNGEATGCGGTLGVPRRDVGGFVKPSGMSFQFDILVALEGAGIDGD
jgi:hypothetical protein